MLEILTCVLGSGGKYGIIQHSSGQMFDIFSSKHNVNEKDRCGSI